MNKRLGVKLAVAIATLGAMTLLQGCNDDDGLVIGGAWAPIGSVSLPGFGTTVTFGTTGGSGQATTATTGTP